MKKLLFLTMLCVLGDITVYAKNKDVVQPAAVPAAMLNNPIKVKYTNYRGESAVRTIVPLGFEFGKTDYHPHEQWLVRVWDVDRNAERMYALKDISQWFAE